MSILVKMQDKPIALTRKGQRTRGQIVDAAAAVAMRSGLDALTVSAICAEAELPRSTFYTYFDDISPVVDAVGAAAAESFAERFSSEHEDRTRGLVRLERCLRDVLSLAETDPALARLAVSLDRTAPALRQRVESEIGEELAGAGQAPDHRPALIASALLALLRDALDARLPCDARDTVPFLMRLAEPR